MMKDKHNWQKSNYEKKQQIVEDCKKFKKVLKESGFFGLDYLYQLKYEYQQKIIKIACPDINNILSTIKPVYLN